MDRAQSSSAEHRAAVPACWSAALDVLLPRANLRERAESTVATALGRALYRVSVLRQPAYVGGLAAGVCLSDQPQAHSATDERSRTGGDLPKAEFKSTSDGSPHLSLSASRCTDRACESSLEQRYHLHPHAGRLRLSGGGDRLVQPFCSQLGDFEHRRRLARSRCSRWRVMRRCQTRNLQHRSRVTIYQPAVFGTVVRAEDLHQHGRPRSCTGQCLYRKTLAHSEVRACVPARLRHARRVAKRASDILSTLQFSSSAPSSEVPHAGRGLLPKQAAIRKGSYLNWGSAPNPGIYRCFLPEWMSFLLAGTSLWLTIGMLDRKTGQRRDATRAPIQARNGWRLYAASVYSPAPNKDRRNTVQRMGSTSWRPRGSLSGLSRENRSS